MTHRRTRAWVTALGLTSLLAPVAISPAFAVPTPAKAALSAKVSADDPDAAKKQVDADLKRLEADLHDTDADLAKAILALKTTESKLPAAEEALASATAKANAADAAHAQSLQDLEVSKANESKAEDELAATRTKIAEGEGSVAAFAQHVYISQGMGSLEVAVSATSPQDLAARLSMSDTVMDIQQISLTRLATARATQVALQDHVRALRVDSEKAEAAASAALTAAQQARSSAASAKAELDALSSRQRAAAQQVQGKLAQEKKRLADMKKESERLAGVLKARAEAARKAAEAAAAAEAARAAAAAAANGADRPAAPAPTTSGGVLAWPLANFVITSEFGPRIDPINGGSSTHGGIDVAAGCGTPVYAAASGSVVSAGAAGGYGNRVVIDHGFVRGVGLATSYNHLQSIAIGGGSVTRGQLIGYEGTTGYSNGCHVHFEVYENGTPVNPRGWL